MQEITFELTDYCPHGCSYCSSSATTDRNKALFLPMDTVIDVIDGVKGEIGRIILSGGEPLAHPQFYDILCYCEDWAKDVVIYSNAIRHIAYNANVIDRIRVEVNLAVFGNVERVHILKGIEQGRAKAMHASAPAGMKCADCSIDKEPCPTCLSAWIGRQTEVVPPAINLSSNWNDSACDQTCSHVVTRPDGSRGKPCKKGT